MQISVIVAIFLLYLGPCLGLCSMLITAGSGGVCVCSCCGSCGGSCGGFCGGSCGDSCRGCYWWVGILFIDLACCAGCLGAVGVRGDVSALEWDGACADGACPGGACIDGAYVGGACADGAYIDRDYADGTYTDKAYSIG